MFFSDPTVTISSPRCVLFEKTRNMKGVLCANIKGTKTLSFSSVKMFGKISLRAACKVLFF